MRMLDAGKSEIDIMDIAYFLVSALAMTEEKLQAKTGEEKIRIVEAEAKPAPQALPPVADSSVQADEKKLSPKDRDHAQKILKELSSDDFLSLLEQASPEQLESFLNMLGPAKEPTSKALRSLFGSLVNIPDEPRGPASVIAWWEARRFVFNVVIFLCGLPTLAIVYLTGLADLGFAISGSIEYGILANICYSAGWACELVARSWWGERAKHLGPILFTLGFAFSIMITLGAGAIMILLFCLIHLIR